VLDARQDRHLALRRPGSVYWRSIRDELAAPRASGRRGRWECRWARRRRPRSASAPPRERRTHEGSERVRRDARALPGRAGLTHARGH
jgi:hypothetical protein